MEDRLPSRWRWMTTRGARRSGVGLILVAVVVGVYLIYLTSRPAVAADITDCSVVGQTAVATVDVHNRSNEVQDWVLDVRFTAADHYITVYSSDLEQLAVRRTGQSPDGARCESMGALGVALADRAGDAPALLPHTHLRTRHRGGGRGLTSTERSGRARRGQIHGAGPQAVRRKPPTRRSVRL